ncbi:MAG: CDF family Co(II)/Ni(II) efflux transporter DmeF [Betaproteobacteria bacterium]
MRTHDLTPWTHEHVFDFGNPAAERGTRVVMWVTAAMMVVEIIGGWWLNSMALLADGLHMSSHALAIGLSAFAYAAARRLADDNRFAFGTWKIEVLAGFASAVFLICIAAVMVFGSVARFISPQPIQYVEAIVIATIGLMVNVGCALILGNAQHGHGETAGHHHAHEPHHHDLNLRSAYVHVIADAATSALAITALTGGLFFGWGWLDPTMGIVGAGVVTLWALGLIRQTGRVLLDSEMDHPVVQEIRVAVESSPSQGDTRLSDLHVWRVGKEAFAAALSVVTHDRGLTPAIVRRQLSIHPELVHVTIEIAYCD